MFAGFPLFLGLLILELAVVHYAHHRRARIGGYFNQIQTGIPCYVTGFINRDDALIFALFIDQTNFAGSYPMVYPVICGYGFPRVNVGPGKITGGRSNKNA